MDINLPEEINGPMKELVLPTQLNKAMKRSGGVSAVQDDNAGLHIFGAGTTSVIMMTL